MLDRIVPPSSPRAPKPKARALAGRPASPAAVPGLPWWIGPGFLALALVLFGRSIRGEHVFDGVTLLRENPLLAHPDPLQLATADWWEGTGKPGGLYRPVALLWLAALHALGGGSAVLVNLGNVLLHALVAWLHCLLFVRLLGPGLQTLALAACAAALALAHPLVVEVVAGQVGAADLLAAGLGTAAALVAATGGGLRAVAAGALAALAVLSKESGVAVVPLALLFEGLRQGGGSDRGRRVLRALGWSSAGVALAFACRAAAIGSLASVDDPVFAGFPIQARLATACATFATYALPLLVFPWRQLAVTSFQDIAPAASFADPRALAGLALLLALLLLPLVALRRGRRELAFGGWLFLAAWLPLSNLVVSSGAIAASRFFYAGLCGLALALVVAIRDAWRARGAWRVLAVLVAAWFGLVLPVAAVREAGAWRTQRELLELHVARAPSSIYWLVDLGTLLAQREPARAARLFEAASALALPNVPGTAFPPEDLLESVFVAHCGAAELAVRRGDQAALARELRSAEALAARAVEGASVLPYREDWRRHQAWAHEQQQPGPAPAR